MTATLTTTRIWINQDGIALCDQHVEPTLAAALEAYPDARCHVILPEALGIPYANRARSSLSKGAKKCQRQHLGRAVQVHNVQSVEDLYDEWNALPLDESFCECCSPLEVEVIG